MSAQTIRYGKNTYTIVLAMPNGALLVRNTRTGKERHLYLSKHAR